MVRFSTTIAAIAAVAAAATVTTTAAANFHLYGVNYNVRAGADWAPESVKCKSADVIAKELAQLKTVTDIVRLYSLTDCNQGTIVVPAAIKAGLKVSLGLWVGPKPSTFAAEKAKFEELLTHDGLINANDIVGIHVGSEAVYRGDVDTTTAIANFQAIKQLCIAKKLAIPVTIADIGDVYLAHPELLDAVDVVSANAFPFWEKKKASKAAAYLYSRLEPLIAQAAKQNKEVVIGETGWATAGVHADASLASPENAVTYFKDFCTIATKHKLKYFYFAAFDEQWKIATEHANSTVEAYFGIFKQNGELKTEYKAIQLDVDVTESSSSSDDDAGDSTAATVRPGSKVDDTEDDNEDDGDDDDTVVTPTSAPGDDGEDDSKTIGGSPAAGNPGKPNGSTTRPPKHKDCDA